MNNHNQLTDIEKEQLLTDLRKEVAEQIARLHPPQLEGFEDTLVLGYMRREHKTSYGWWIAGKKNYVLVKLLSPDHDEVMVWSTIQGNLFTVPAFKVKII